MEESTVDRDGSGDADSPFNQECHTLSDCTDLGNAICNFTIKVCECHKDYPVFIQDKIHDGQKCVKAAELKTQCDYDEQCLHNEKFATCGTNNLCECQPEYKLKDFENLGPNCVQDSSGSMSVDPAMIGVLVGFGLMFIIICVVLRLFSKARFRENRSIFNTPNPRLMNASMFKESKLLSPSRGADRRGSRTSIRGGPPSRTGSIVSMKEGRRSPNGSLSKARRGSTLSTASATGSTVGAGAGAAPSSAKSQSSSGGLGGGEDKQPTQTTVSIEAVD